MESKEQRRELLEEYKKLLGETVIRGDLGREEFTEKYLPLVDVMNKVRPKKLYRYRACNDLNFDALHNDKIFFNTPEKFNDPHDCFSYVNKEEITEILDQFSPEALKQEARSIYESSHLVTEAFSPNILPAMENGYRNIKSLSSKEFESLLEQTDSRLSQILMRDVEYLIELTHSQHLKLSRELTYASCFSENINSTLMWAHYADYHKGFAIEYDVDDIMNVSQKCSNCANKCSALHSSGLYPIVYGDERYDATEFEIELLKFLVSNLTIGTEHFCTPDQLFQIKTNSYKGFEWEYEEEWRLIYSCTSEHPESKFEVIKPKAIYLGSKMPNINKEIVKKLTEGKGIDIYEMDIKDDSKDFILDSKKLN